MGYLDRLGHIASNEYCFSYVIVAERLTVFSR